MVGRDAARAQRERRERRVPDRRLARLGPQPLAVLDQEAVPALDRLARRVGSSRPLPSAASAMIDQTHGGWIPPHEPSASCRSRIHCSASPELCGAARHGAARRARLPRDRADRAQVDVATGAPGAATARARARRTSAAPSTRSRRSRTASCGGSRTSSGGIGTIFCHGHWPMSAMKHFVKRRAFGIPPSRWMKASACLPGSTPARRHATYASIEVERSGGPSNQIDHVPSSRIRAMSSFAMRRSSSGVRRPR